MRLEKRATGVLATLPTPSIVVIFSPLEGLVRTTSSPRVVARMLTLLSIAIAPPVNIGAMTLPTSNVVLRGCFAAILSVVLRVATTIARLQLEEERINFLGFSLSIKRGSVVALIDKNIPRVGLFRNTNLLTDDLRLLRQRPAEHWSCLVAFFNVIAAFRR